jgi:hypothetical protein
MNLNCIFFKCTILELKSIEKAFYRKLDLEKQKNQTLKLVNYIFLFYKLATLVFENQ